MSPHLPDPLEPDYNRPRMAGERRVIEARQVGSICELARPERMGRDPAADVGLAYEGRTCTTSAANQTLACVACMCAGTAFWPTQAARSDDLNADSPTCFARSSARADDRPRDGLPLSRPRATRCHASCGTLRSVTKAANAVT
jgi:hypothetical protein